MLVHSCCRLGHSANPPGFRLSFADWLRPLALPLSAGPSAPPAVLEARFAAMSPRRRKREAVYTWRRYAYAWSPPPKR